MDMNKTLKVGVIVKSFCINNDLLSLVSVLVCIQDTQKYLDFSHRIYRQALLEAILS